MKQYLKNKKLYILLPLFVLSILSILFMNSGMASSEEEPVLCTKSDEYIRWEKLSEEEKENTIMPMMCDREKDEINYRYFSFDVKGSLPTTFDLRKQSYAPVLKDQMSTGGCWAFATTTVLETYARKNLNIKDVYSTRHIEYSSTRSFLNNQVNENGYNRNLGSGGNAYMSSNYLINGNGPILESEMPFVNSEENININEIKNKNTKLDVNNIALIEGNSICSASEIEDIKRYVYNNGAVFTTTYMTLSNSYYNSSNAAYYYNGSNDSNHAITIIGWDDNYSRTNFSSYNRPKANGAWIVQNSYGTSFGKSGYFYLSYENVLTCGAYMSITDVDTTIEDNNYVLDKLGYNAFMGYGSVSDGITEAYGMNVFKKEYGKEEILKEVAFGTNGTGTYKVYYKEGNASTTSVSNMTLIGSGTIEYSGYVTHKLNNPITIGKNVTSFSIVVYYDMDVTTRPVPVSAKIHSKYQYITAEAKTSFLSSNGSTWTDLNSSSDTIIASIKAYTDDVDTEFSIENKQVTYDDKINVKITTKTRNIESKNLSVVVKNSSNATISNTTTFKEENNTVRYIDISLSNTLTSGNYKIYIYHSGELVAETTISIDISTITSSVYTINQTNKVIYVDQATNISTFKENVSSSSSVYNEGSNITSGYIKTGMTIGNYVIIVKGDVNKDGIVNIADVVMIADHTIKQNVLTEDITKNAAEVTNDNIINIADVIKIADYSIDSTMTLWR